MNEPILIKIGSAIKGIMLFGQHETIESVSEVKRCKMVTSPIYCWRVELIDGRVVIIANINDIDVSDNDYLVDNYAVGFID